MAQVSMSKTIPIVAGFAAILFTGVFLGGCFLRDTRWKIVHQPMTELPQPGTPPDADSPTDTIRRLQADVPAGRDDLAQAQRRLEAAGAAAERREREDRQLRADLERQVRDAIARESQQHKVQADAAAERERRQRQAELGQLTATIAGLEQRSRKIVPETGASVLPVEPAPDPFRSGVLGSSSFVWVEPIGRPRAATPERRSRGDRGASGEAGLVGELAGNVPGMSRLPTVADLQPAGCQPAAFAGGAVGNAAARNPTLSPPGDAARGLAPIGKAPAEPVYTIANLSGLLESKLFTALIGRIPRNNRLLDPFPFRILIGRDNLAASGLHVPDQVFGMVAGGTAVGDFTLRCVRGDITKVTFIFADGTIQTVTADSVRTGAGGSSNSQVGRTGGGGNRILGYLTDPQGNPCIPGQLVTNAPELVSAQVGINAARAAAEAYAAAQTTTIVGGGLGTATTGVDGQIGKYVLGRTLSDAGEEVNDYFESVLNDSFDAVYIPAGGEVSVLIEEEIPIDYKPNGRKLNHATSSRPGGARGGYLP